MMVGACQGVAWAAAKALKRPIEMKDRWPQSESKPRNAKSNLQDGNLKLRNSSLKLRNDDLQSMPNPEMRE